MVRGECGQDHHSREQHRQEQRGQGQGKDRRNAAGQECDGDRLAWRPRAPACLPGDAPPARRRLRLGLIPLISAGWVATLLLSVLLSVGATVWVLTERAERASLDEARRLMDVIAASARVAAEAGDFDQIDGFLRGLDRSGSLAGAGLWYTPMVARFRNRRLDGPLSASMPTDPVAQEAARRLEPAELIRDDMAIFARPILDRGALSGVVWVEIPRADRFAVLAGLISATAPVGGAILLLLGAVAALLTRRLVRPVVAATAVADRIADGDLTPEIALHGSREAEHLSAALTRMTATLRQNIAVIHDLANRDAVTNLPNRAAFTRRASDQVARMARMDRRCALMFIDLDGFKAINDTHGHDIGDRLLRAFSERLADTIRDTDRILARPDGGADRDLVGRLGGDEFTVLLRDLPDRQGAERVAVRLLAAVAQGFPVAGRQLAIGVSIGIALMPPGPVAFDRLLSAADDAMYEVKRAGKNSFRVTELAA